MKHVHVSALTGITIALYLIIIMSFYRLSAVKLAASENKTARTLGEALGFIFA